MKKTRNYYTFADCGLKANDKIYLYPLDSAFKNKYTDSYELTIVDPNKNTVSDPKIKDSNYKSISEFVYSKFDYIIKQNRDNKPRSMNCRQWIISKKTYIELQKEIKNNPKLKNDLKELSNYIKEHSLYSIFKGKK